MRDTNRSKRAFLKTAGLVAFGGSIAGCTGQDGSSGDGGGQQTTQSGGGQQTTDEGPMSTEEWRKEASRQAAKELEDGPLEYHAARGASDAFKEIVLNRDFEGVYEPLTNNIEQVVGGDTTQMSSKYARLMASGNAGMDVMQFRVAPLVAEGVPFGDLTEIPSFQELDDGLKTPPHIAPLRLSAYGLDYNPEVMPNPPTTLDGVLELGEGEVAIDYTPSAVAVGYVIAKKSEDYIRRLGEIPPVMHTSNRGMTQACGEGQFAVAFMGSLGAAYDYREQGLSVTPVENPDLWVWYKRQLSMSAEPKKPWAAKLFIDFKLNSAFPETQTIENGSIAFDFSTAKPQEALELFPSDADKKLWSLEDFDRDAATLVKRYQELTGAPVG